MFSVRVVTTDHYLADPVAGLDPTQSQFRGSEVKRVPVLRVFGATPAGQKTCMHVHGVFPYLYVPYDGTQPWDRYLRQFAASLDTALNVAAGQTHARTQHVYKIALVSGIPMYGYHPKELQFLKIYLYNPSSVKRAADLLLAGAVMNRSFQPHEAHIPYNLQIFIDYNLYGMNLLHAAAIKFRKPKPQSETEAAGPGVVSSQSSSAAGSRRSSSASVSRQSSLDLSLGRSTTPSQTVWDPHHLPTDLCLPDNIERVSTCELEVDVVAADILNRLEVNANVGSNPGLAAIWEDERQRCRDQGQSSQITPPESQEHEDVLVADSETELRQRLQEIIELQKPYCDSERDTESDMSVEEEEESQVDLPPTPASPALQLRKLLSESQDGELVPSSQDTAVGGEEEDEGEEAAIISLESIQRCLSTSQHFTASQEFPDSGDRSLTDLLASLAEEEGPPPPGVSALEEGDSILAATPKPPSQTDLQQDEADTLEMSQPDWPGDKGEEEDRAEEEHDLQGMDDSWSESQWATEEKIPQFDGASDEKPEEKPSGDQGPQGKQASTHGTGPPQQGSSHPHFPPYSGSSQGFFPSSHPPTSPQAGFSEYGQWGSSELSPPLMSGFGGSGGWNPPHGPWNPQGRSPPLLSPSGHHGNFSPMGYDRSPVYQGQSYPHPSQGYPRGFHYPFPQHCYPSHAQRGEGPSGMFPGSQATASASHSSLPPHAHPHASHSGQGGEHPPHPHPSSGSSSSGGAGPPFSLGSSPPVNPVSHSGPVDFSGAMSGASYSRASQGQGLNGGLQQSSSHMSSPQGLSGFHGNKGSDGRGSSTPVSQSTGAVPVSQPGVSSYHGNKGEGARAAVKPGVSKLQQMLQAPLAAAQPPRPCPMVSSPPSSHTSSSTPSPQSSQPPFAFQQPGMSGGVGGRGGVASPTHSEPSYQRLVQGLETGISPTGSQGAVHSPPLSQSPFEVCTSPSPTSALGREGLVYRQLLSNRPVSQPERCSSSSGESLQESSGKPGQDRDDSRPVSEAGSPRGESEPTPPPPAPAPSRKRKPSKERGGSQGRGGGKEERDCPSALANLVSLVTHLEPSARQWGVSDTRPGPSLHRSASDAGGDGDSVGQSSSSSLSPGTPRFTMASPWSRAGDIIVSKTPPPSLLVRSTSFGTGSTGDGSDRGKRGRMKKLGLPLTRCRSLSSSEPSAASNAAYTYAFPMPRPLTSRYQRPHLGRPRPPTPDLRVVHLHPRDARRYSLLKIGRELVPLLRLQPCDVSQISESVRAGHDVSAMLACGPSCKTKDRLPRADGSPLTASPSEAPDGGGGVGLESGPQPHFLHAPSHTHGESFLGLGSCVDDVSLINAAWSSPTLSSEVATSELRSPHVCPPRSPILATLGSLVGQDSALADTHPCPAPVKDERLSPEVVSAIVNATKPKSVPPPSSHSRDANCLRLEIANKASSVHEIVSSKESLSKQLSASARSGKTFAMEESVRNFPMDFASLADVDSIPSSVALETEAVPSRQLSTPPLPPTAELQDPNSLPSSTGKSSGSQSKKRRLWKRSPKKPGHKHLLKSGPGGKLKSRLKAESEKTMLRRKPVARVTPALREVRVKRRGRPRRTFEDSASEEESASQNTSRASSCCSSRKESSDSEGLLEEWSVAHHHLRQRRRRSHTSHCYYDDDDYIPYLGPKARGKRSFVNYKPNAFTHLFEEEDRKRKSQHPEQSRKRKRRPGHGEGGEDVSGVEGVDYIVVGKFKGYRAMEVRLWKLAPALEAAKLTEYRTYCAQSPQSVSLASSRANTPHDTPQPSPHPLPSQLCADPKTDLCLPNRAKVLSTTDDNEKEGLEAAEFKPSLEEAVDQNCFKTHSARAECIIPASGITLHTKVNGCTTREDPMLEDDSLDSSSSDDIIAGSQEEGTSLPTSDNSSSSAAFRGFSRFKRGGLKRSLTRNQRLGVAFLTTRPRRKKVGGGGGGKLMSSLSILHQATLANLTETMPSSVASPGDDSTASTSNAANTSAEESPTAYEDALYKLSLFSPPPSDQGETSPPVPLSPGEMEVGKGGELKQDTIRLMPGRCSARGEVRGAFRSDALTTALCRLEAAPGTRPVLVSNLPADALFETPRPSLENTRSGKSPDQGSSGESGIDMPDLHEESSSSTTNPGTGSRVLGVKDDGAGLPFPVKTAVIKVTPLSLMEIYSATSVRGAGEGKAGSTSPPDLGPPNIPRYSPKGVSASLLGGKSPPQLTADSRLTQTDQDVLGDSQEEKARCDANVAAPDRGDETARTPRSDPVPREVPETGASGWHAHRQTVTTSPSSTFPASPRELDDCSVLDLTSKGGNPTPDQLSTPPRPAPHHTPRGDDSRSELSSPAKTVSPFSMSRILSPEIPSSHQWGFDRRHFVHSFPERGCPSSGYAEQRGPGIPVSDERFSEQFRPGASIVNKPYPERRSNSSQPGSGFHHQRHPSLSQEHHQSSPPFSDVPGSKPPPSPYRLDVSSQNRPLPSHSQSYPSPEEVTPWGPGRPPMVGGARGARRGRVVCLLSSPPSSASVRQSAPSFGLYPAMTRPAYCSNPRDVPDTHRELGETQPRLHTERVRDLEEMDSALPGQGLAAWRTALVARGDAGASLDRLDASLLDRFSTEPETRHVLTGNGRRVVAPCRLPPSCRVVATWLAEKCRLKGNGGNVREGNGGKGGKEICRDSDVDSGEEDGSLSSTLLGTSELVGGDSTLTELLLGHRSSESKPRRAERSSSPRDGAGTQRDGASSQSGSGGGEQVNRDEENGDRVSLTHTQTDKRGAVQLLPDDRESSIRSLVNETERSSRVAVPEKRKEEEEDVEMKTERRRDDDAAALGSGEKLAGPASRLTASDAYGTSQELKEKTMTVREKHCSEQDVVNTTPRNSQSSPEVVWLTRTLSREGEGDGWGGQGQDLLASPGRSSAKTGQSRWDRREPLASPPCKYACVVEGGRSEGDSPRTVLSRGVLDGMQSTPEDMQIYEDVSSPDGESENVRVCSTLLPPEEHRAEVENRLDAEASLRFSPLSPDMDLGRNHIEKSAAGVLGSRDDDRRVVTPPPLTSEHGAQLVVQGEGIREGAHPAKFSHSTPLRRQLSADLFQSASTPVAPAEEEVLQFVTPRSVGPGKRRRLSGTTEKSLRRALAPVQEQLCTPGPSKTDTSQIEGASPRNTFGFKVTQLNVQDSKALHEHQYLTVMTMELHAETRADLYPDPEQDAIVCIFYCVLNDVPPGRGPRQTTGAIVVDPPSCGGVTPPPPTLLQKSGVELQEVEYVRDEEQLLDTFIETVLRYDPDILVGFEIQRTSWGYALHRASHLSVPLCAKISRVPLARGANRHSAQQDTWGAAYSSEIHVAGRIVLNLWRVIRHEVALNIYTYENIAFHVLHQRVPTYSFRSLTSWFQHRTHLLRWRVVEHYVSRVEGQLELMDHLDLIGKTSELARVFGIEFFDVLSRGTQYRVESMMLRLAKPLNFIAVSPSVHQRARMRAPECIPLTLEPESRVYTDPVVVLDFQSLYPSIMIAYNYCFSTCLGRLNSLAQAHEGPIEFGCTALPISPATIKKLENDVTISPNGVVFAKQHIRKGVISQMVEEILRTRIMVKKMMKNYKGDKSLYRMLDARQLGLKLIANVTYGYTGANFSGRMPCIEVGDSIVRKAREALERSIQLVHDTPRWDARVIYGDTDSMFILLKGRSRAEAFVVGQEMANAVTAMFPKPMKLRFEKVYLPCVLQTKKRYAGFMYETPDQQEPVFDAKGIETVRRDNCGAVSKVLERSMKLLFTTLDVSKVREYVERQCAKLLAGRVSLQDCIFAKEFRGMTGYKPGACVPALEIARKLVQRDKNAEPRVGERIPYVVVYGPPGLPLIQLVRSPEEVLADPSLRINATYYISKQVLPPLQRMLSLLGVDVFAWYNEMPKVHRIVPPSLLGQEAKKGTISHYFGTADCLVCESQTKQPICPACLRNPQLVSASLTSRIQHWDRTYNRLAQVCYTCMGVQDTCQPCASLDCPVRFRRQVAGQDLSRGNSLRATLDKVLAF